VPHLPWHNHLFVPVLLRVLLLIAVGFAAVLVARRRRHPLRVWRRSTLFLRARSWLVIGLLFVVAVFTGGVVAFLLASYAVIWGLAELARVIGIPRRYALLLLLWGEVGLLVAALARDFFIFLPFGFFILLALIAILSGGEEAPGDTGAEGGAQQHGARQVADTLFAYVYVALPLAYIVYAESSRPWGLNFLVVVAVAVACSDIAAFVAGSALKGPRIPGFDAGKSWTGALGNLIGAAVAVALLWVAVPKLWSIAEVVVLTVVVAFGCVWGDLTASLVERWFPTTAPGTILVGYGGVLDRVDSLLMAFPLSFYAVLLTEKLLR
jgi:phosphatidate cytidylyltransferase